MYYGYNEPKPYSELIYDENIWEKTYVELKDFKFGGSNENFI